MFYFYHLSKFLESQLYSSNKDYVLAQIQKLFNSKKLHLKKSFAQINRVADACLEDKKIVFEIQCSPITESEAAAKIQDYQSLGYEMIWILSDKHYNKRIFKPAEKLLRKYLTYYISIQKEPSYVIYDQFEIISGNRRIKKSKRLIVDPTKVYINQPSLLEAKSNPKQIRDLKSRFFCEQDRAYISKISPLETLRYWRKLEIYYAKNSNSILIWLKKHIFNPYQKALTKYLT